MKFHLPHPQRYLCRGYFKQMTSRLPTIMINNASQSSAEVRANLMITKYDVEYFGGASQNKRRLGRPRVSTPSSAT